MSNHTAKIYWERPSAEFEYETYSRKHTWSFDNGLSVVASAAADFKGDLDAIDPEEALVAAASGCHMLTFLAVAAKKRFKVKTYSDSPVGTLEKNEAGVMAVTRIVLSPVVTFDSEAIPTSEELAKLHESAHRNCFIANSIKADIQIAH
jgi:organic hydroperoxide reductase OsmC/OhrA